jgi:hypothetical protein
VVLHVTKIALVLQRLDPLYGRLVLFRAPGTDTLLIFSQFSTMMQYLFLFLADGHCWTGTRFCQDCIGRICNDRPFRLTTTFRGTDRRDG